MRLVGLVVLLLSILSILTDLPTSVLLLRLRGHV